MIKVNPTPDKTTTKAYEKFQNKDTERSYSELYFDLRHKFHLKLPSCLRMMTLLLRLDESTFDTALCKQENKILQTHLSYLTLDF